MADEFRPLKDAFGRFVTGIGVAACAGEEGGGRGRYAALTINSFTSVSLDPPLVLWCIERRASAYSAFMAAASYSVSILRADQRAQCDRFAGYRPKPLSDAEIEIWETGAPLLRQRLAGFDCRVVARHKAGDHVILVGEVLRSDCREGQPLMYFASNLSSGPATPSRVKPEAAQ